MFQNRHDAALQLVARLQHYRGQNGIVLAIPRGGVPLGFVIAQALGFPLEVALSKKIGHPSNSEYAIGSVTLDSAVVNENARGVSEEYIREETARVQAKLRENFKLFMGGHTPTSLKDKTVIVVDDGIATGHTMVSIVQSIRKSQPRKLIVAVPVAPPQAAEQLASLADEFVCLSMPSYFMAVGQFYVDFEQVSDEEVIELLQKSAATTASRSGT